MSYAEVKKNIWKNSISNYIRTVVGMVLGLFMFRLLYQSLTLEQFGFWSLLWSVFGYGILLDFGFGFTAQKRVAEMSVHKDWDGLSRVLSTIVFVYCGIAAVIVALVLLGSHALVRWFGVSPANAVEFRQVMILFFVGIGIAFPMGVFPEILRGQQRIRLANNIMSATIAIKFLFIAAAIYFHWSFFVIMAIALGFSVAPDILSALLAFKRLPNVRIAPKFFAWNTVGDTMKFSIFAYINTAANIIMAKTDQIVISASLAVAAVAVYQAGLKVAEVFGTFTRQLQDTLSPAAAHLHASGDRHALRDLMVVTTRWSVILATPLYLLCAFYMDDLLHLLTGEKQPAADAWWVGQTLLLWHYTGILTHSVSKRIFMMTGHERRLMRLGVWEAGLNLALSIGLVLWFRNVLCVAIGSLIPTLVIGWGWLWPWAARECGMSSWELLRRVAWPVWGACLPMLAFLALARWAPWLHTHFNFGMLVLDSALACGIGAAGLWFLVLTVKERNAVADRLRMPFLRSRVS